MVVFGVILMYNIRKHRDFQLSNTCRRCLVGALTISTRFGALKNDPLIASHRVNHRRLPLKFIMHYGVKANRCSLNV